MPKKIFNNISKEKQEMFINAAMEEFTSKSFEQVSVNSIVKKASISRGSFYTYFENKDELFNFIFNQVKEERFNHAKELISESNADFFVFIKKLFEYDFDNFSTNNRYSLFRNYIHYIQVNKRGSIRDSIIMPLNGVFSKKGESYSTIFNIDKYGMNENQFLDLVEMTMLIVVNTFIKFESESLSKEEILKLFNSRINILENGTRRRDM